jgi:phosphopantothenoylcysteine synthetase/decarboxylase
MRFLVTSGPTYEPLDEVRRLTNFSTGRLGTELAEHLSKNGHEVTLLQGSYSTYLKAHPGYSVVQFTTTQNLAGKLKEASHKNWDALFHVAAVSDFKFGKVFKKAGDGTLQVTTSGKFSTREGPLLAELLPTPKIINQLRSDFKEAKIFGWKYEVDGSSAEVAALGLKQIQENFTDYCVLNGPAYGQGFGILSSKNQKCHCDTPEDLFRELLRLATIP